MMEIAAVAAEDAMDETAAGEMAPDQINLDQMNPEEAAGPDPAGAPDPEAARDADLAAIRNMRRIVSLHRK